MYGYTPQREADAIQSLLAGKAFVASTGDTKAYNEALSYLKGYSVQSGQAAIGTDALLALPGAPGIIARSTLAAGGGCQAGTGIGQVIDGNYSNGALNIGLGTAAIFGSMAAQSAISKPGGTNFISGDTSLSRNSTIGNAEAAAADNVGNATTGSLSGQPTKLPPNASAENIRSLQRENEGAVILSQNGYHVEQNPVTAGVKNPDYKNNGEVFDNIAPKTNSVRNIYDRALEKVNSGQTNNVVINLADTKASVSDLQKQFSDWPIKGLEKVIVIDQSGKPIRIK